MVGPADKLFRPAAMGRLSSPEQLDQLVGITRPADWLAVLVIALLIGVALVWSVIGRIPTRASGEGILTSDAGRVVDAVSAVAGRLATVEVAVGDRVAAGQLIARLSQTDTEQRHRNATDVVREREGEYETLVATIERELTARAANFAAQQAALTQVITTAEQRLAYLKQTLEGVEGLAARGFATRREL